jgi:hypothetical protein
MLIRQCTPRVYDTAYLHGACDRFKSLSLTKYFLDVKGRYDAIYAQGRGFAVVPDIQFFLQGETARRYGSDLALGELAHEAGYDSLITAQIFAYLRAIAPAQVKQATNRLFLYKSVEYIDLDGALLDGSVAKCMFDLSRVTLLVAALDAVGGLDAPRQIAVAGYTYKWMDHTHILVVLRASGGAAVRKAGELAQQVQGVAQWMDFNDWRSMQIPAEDTDQVEAQQKDSVHEVHGDARAQNHKLWEQALASASGGTLIDANDAGEDTDVGWKFKVPVLLVVSAGLLLLAAA